MRAMLARRNPHIAQQRRFPKCAPRNQSSKQCCCTWIVGVNVKEAVVSRRRRRAAGRLPRGGVDHAPVLRQRWGRGAAVRLRGGRRGGGRPLAQHRLVDNLAVRHVRHLHVLDLAGRPRLHVSRFSRLSGYVTALA